MNELLVGYARVSTEHKTSLLNVMVCTPSVWVMIGSMLITV
jgi:hypothetical protein